MNLCFLNIAWYLSSVSYHAVLSEDDGSTSELVKVESV